MNNTKCKQEQQTKMINFFLIRYLKQKYVLHNNNDFNFEFKRFYYKGTEVKNKY